MTPPGAGALEEAAAGLLTGRALARVNLGAIERNCSRLARELGSGTGLCAVVKADAYGHGMLPCARAAQRGGAGWLAVATAGEAAELRSGGVDLPILVMGALRSSELDLALGCRADVVAWSEPFVSRVAALGGGRVHVKLDSGMGRLGTRDAEQASELARTVAHAPETDLVGAMTHFATADDRDDPFLSEQLGRFTEWVTELRHSHHHVLAHAANSAATLRERAAHFDLVRCGIAVYGLDPFGEDPAPRGLEAALELSSYVAVLKPCGPGESAGYGRRFVASVDTELAVLPIGYGDGWRRGLTNNADVLIRGRRRPLVGTVSMDNVTVEVGRGSDVDSGDRAVLIGSQGDERITAEEVARRLETINYEVTCALLPRVIRVHHRDDIPDPTVRSGHPPAPE